MNTNEIQIRLTADIQALQSALAKAQKTLQDFEAKNSAETEKSNKAKERQLGIIEKLNTQAKKLQVSIKQATSKDDIAKFNQELEKTKKQLSFLNNLGKGPSSPVGLINNLNAKIKILKQSIAEATNEKSVARLNAELERTQQELKRIESLGKAVTTPAVRSFDNLKRSAGAATGSAIAFSRIIQDAPFGIIGVANNLQSFGEQFAALGGKATTAGQKLSMFFSALITPANLAILAVSALTAAWQAYSLGVFDSLFKTESLNDRLKDLNESTKSATANAGVELIKLENLRSVIEDETLSRDKRLRAVNELIDTYPKLFSLADKEKLLNGDLITSYDILTKAIIAKAKASIGEQELPNLIKQKEIVDSQLKLREQQLATEKGLLENSSRLTKITETFTGSEYEQVQRRIKPLKADVEELTLRQKELQISIDGYTQSVVSYANEYEQFIDNSINSTSELTSEVQKLKRTFEELINLPNGGLPRSGDVEALRRQFQRLQEGGKVGTTGQEFIDTEINKIKEAGIITEAPFSGLAQNFELESDQIKLQVEDLAQVFTGLGSVIGRAFKNPQLGTFLGEFLRFAAQLVAANFKIAGSNAVVGASEAAKATGPAAPITLPAFIAGALGVVAAAFAAFGNFGSSGGSPSAGVGSTFTNREFGGPVSKGRAYIVGERRPELFVPNTNGIIVPQLPSMDYSGASMQAGAMAVDVNIRGVSYGDDILFTVQQAQIRRGLR